MPCVLLQSCATSGSKTGSSKPIPLAEVVKQVTAAVDQFRNTKYAEYAELTSAEFNFQTVKGTEGELSVKPLVFGIDFSASREVTHTFTFMYTKPGKHRLSIASAEEKELTKELVEMMDRAAQSAEKVLTGVGLSLTEVDLSVEFAVEYAAGVNVEVPVKLVTLGGGVTARHSETQSVKLTFERRKLGTRSESRRRKPDGTCVLPSNQGRCHSVGCGTPSQTQSATQSATPRIAAAHIMQ